MLLLAEAVRGELQLLLKDCYRPLRLVEQFLYIFLYFTAILIFKITNVLQFLQKILLEVITRFAAYQLLEPGDLLTVSFEPIEHLLGRLQGVIMVLYLRAHRAKLKTIRD